MKELNMIKSFLEKELSNRHSVSSVESSSSQESKNNSSIRSNCKKSCQIDDVDKAWSSAASKCNVIKLKEIYAKDRDQNDKDRELIDKDRELIDKKDYFTGYAAVHWSVKHARNDVTRWLFGLNADVNLRTNGGYTPLHIAAMHQRISSILLLVNDYGADINLRDYSGRKASHYLKLETPDEIKELLQVPLSKFPTSSLSVPTTLIPSSKSMPTLSRENTFEMAKNTFNESFRKKKRALSITKSFKHRNRKMMFEKRGSDVEIESSSPLSPTKTRTNSIHDDLANAIDRKLSLNDENVFTPNITRKKSFASENVVNGYAGYLTNSKYRSRDQKNTSLENVSEKQPWGINTWV